MAAVLLPRPVHSAKFRSYTLRVSLFTVRLVSGYIFRLRGRLGWRPFSIFTSAKLAGGDWESSSLGSLLRGTFGVADDEEHQRRQWRDDERDPEPRPWRPAADARHVVRGHDRGQRADDDDPRPHFAPSPVCRVGDDNIEPAFDAGPPRKVSRRPPGPRFLPKTDMSKP